MKHFNCCISSELNVMFARTVLQPEIYHSLYRQLVYKLPKIARSTARGKAAYYLVFILYM
jgi:hypothetical protein